jgi:adenosylcobinamide amidohydrolase
MLGAPPVGTINIVAVVPVAMTDAALVNAVMTMTEAKTQALLEAGFPCTGTASDALCLAVPNTGPQELFGGPRSPWGARLARAVHTSVRRGAEAWRPWDGK